MISSIKTQPSSPLQPQGYSPLQRAAFNLSSRVLDTYRLADVSPLSVYHGLIGDKVSISVKPNLNSYSLSAPLLSNLQCHTAAFSVPQVAIMPNNYDIFKVPPKVGSDVPAQLAPAYSLKVIYNTLYAQLQKCENHMFDAFPAVFGSGGYVLTGAEAIFAEVTIACRLMATVLNFYSDNSVLRRLGVATYNHKQYNLNTAVSSLPKNTITAINDVLSTYGLPSGTVPAFSVSDTRTLETDFWTFFAYSYKSLNVGLSNGKRYAIFTADPSNSNFGVLNVPVLRSFMEDVMNYDVNYIAGVPTGAIVDYYTGVLVEEFGGILQLLSRWLRSCLMYYGLNCPTSSSGTGATASLNSSDVNLLPVFAYQMACSEFFTNDNLDEVCTARKYLSRLAEFVRLSSSDNQSYPNFELNGQLRTYDVCSYFFQSWAFNIFYNIGTNGEMYYDNDSDGYMYNFLSYMDALFGTRRSLVFENYYLSSKPRPLAVTGSLDPATSSSSFDVFKSVLVTKYLNAVNRMPQKVRDFCQRMFGSHGTIIEPQPSFLGHYSFDVQSNSAVGTTDENLGNRASYIASSDSSEKFTFILDDDSIVVLMVYFDLPRCEIDFTSPFAYKYDRFDDYQPFLEGLGDDVCPLACVQPQAETVTITSSSLTPFGYLPRFSEYKVATSRANGAFCGGSAQVDDWGNSFSLPPTITEISDDLIRYKNSEFDRFFSSLTNLGSDYFHIIASTKVSIAAERNMSYVSDVKLN